jgi:phage tail-like protein
MTETHFNFFGQPDQPSVPTIVGVRAVGRQKVEIEIDPPVVVREKTNLIVAPVDRFTPITWSGASYEAANPENYSFARPSTGTKTGAGEAVELVATYAEEAEEYWEEQEFDGTDYIVASRVWVYTDYQHTARADYEITVENPAFVGYIVSQVARSTYTMIEQLPGIARRLDDAGTGDLEKFFTAAQEVFDRVLEDIDAFFPDLCEIDRARPEFLDAILYDLGDPFSGLFDLTINEKRKLIDVLVQMYRQKGTCEGVVNVVRFFTGVVLLGCTTSLAGRWRLHGGSYPSTTVPPGGPYQLDSSAVLGPGTLEELWSFYVLHATPASLTADELAKIAAVVDYMKPASSIYMGVRAP